jgi:L-fuculose-phosphate aldolase
MGFRCAGQIGVDDLSVVGSTERCWRGRRRSAARTDARGLYNAFGEAGAVIHAHPYWTNVFVAKGRPIVPALETTEKFGVIECIEEAHGYSKELAEKVVSHFRAKRDQWEKTALEVILPRHGIVAMGRDINHCFDIVDRIESDCRCQILGKLLDL